MSRVILHCDLNNFYASVECASNNLLKNIPMAVAGNPAERSGIILAKNNIAKQFGVKTGETIWQARQKCPQLKTVSPHFTKYCDYSQRVRQIYMRYSDQIESFGIDECWVDIGNSIKIFGSAYKIANNIRVAVKQELGLTISIGISFNKIFSKLGSDMRKPDAITVISEENFKEKLWGLPVENLLGVGRATQQKLYNSGIYTIGDVALSDWRYLESILGKNGISLWGYANGFNESPVIHQDFKYEVKSIGNSTTCAKDLTDNFDVWRVILCLSQEVANRLKETRSFTSQIVLGIKTSDFSYYEHSIQLEKPTCLLEEISNSAMALYMRVGERYDSIRAVGVRAVELSEESAGVQTSIFNNEQKITPKIAAAPKFKSKEKRLEDSVHKIQQKYGKVGAMKAVLLLEKDVLADKDKLNLKLPNFH